MTNDECLMKEFCRILINYMHRATLKAQHETRTSEPGTA